MTIKFIHIRNMFNENNGDDSYISCKGGKTIAFEVFKHPENDNRVVVHYAEAKCHERDNFCRRIGRIKSSGRLHSDRLHQELVIEDSDSIYDAIMAAVRHV